MNPRRIAADTAQLRAWRSEFGDAYAARNAPTEAMIEVRVGIWRRLLESLTDDPPASILEVGANVGLNLRALDKLTKATLHGLEPNPKARVALAADGVVAPERVIDGTAAAIPLADAHVDLVFTSGVLIHIAPDDLLAACREIHRVARKYILSIEYFSARPEQLEYRGHKNLLFKRDFGNFWLDNFDDLRVGDYGFFWKPVTGLDNLTWWLFQKR